MSSWKEDNCGIPLRSTQQVCPVIYHDWQLYFAAFPNQNKPHYDSTMVYDLQSQQVTTIINWPSAIKYYCSVLNKEESFCYLFGDCFNSFMMIDLVGKSTDTPIKVEKWYDDYDNEQEPKQIPIVTSYCYIPQEKHLHLLYQSTQRHVIRKINKNNDSTTILRDKKHQFISQPQQTKLVYVKFLNLIFSFGCGTFNKIRAYCIENKKWIDTCLALPTPIPKFAFDTILVFETIIIIFYFFEELNQEASIFTFDTKHLIIFKCTQNGIPKCFANLNDENQSAFLDDDYKINIINLSNLQKWQIPVFDLIPYSIQKEYTKDVEPLVMGYIREKQIIHTPIQLQKLILSYFPIFMTE